MQSRAQAGQRYKTQNIQNPYEYNYENESLTDVNKYNAGINKTTKYNHNLSPYKYNLNQSSAMQSVDNILSSRFREKQFVRNPHPYGSKQYQSYQNQQISFLKEKLIQTHNKLLKELSNNNLLTEQVQSLQEILRNKQMVIKQLQGQNKGLKNQLDQTNRALEHKVTKNQQRYRSIQNKLQNENKKNFQLKQDLDSMRNKMMEAAMTKNMLEQANSQFKLQVRNLQSQLKNVQLQLKQKNQQLLNLEKQLKFMINKTESLQNENKDQKLYIQELSGSVNDKRSNQKQLQHLLGLQQQKNNNFQKQINNLQEINRRLQFKTDQLQKQVEKNKDQIYWLNQDKQKTTRNLNDQIQKLKDDLEALNNMYKQTERQLLIIKKRPYQEAEKKRRHYQITKQFVHQLQNQQQLYGNNGSRAVLSRPPLQQPANTFKLSPSRGTTGNTSTSITPNKNSPNSRNYGYFQNKSPVKCTSSTLINNNNSFSINNGNLHPRSSYQDDQKCNMISGHESKKKYTSNKQQIQQLEIALSSCNMQKKKIKAQIDRLEQNNIKSREAVVKKKRLQQQLQYQEEKIKKLKEQLRKLRIL